MKLGLHGIALALVCTLFAGLAQADQPGGDDLDPGTVYRLQPSLDGPELLPVAAAEVQPGMVYKYYNNDLGRHVWGFATDDGAFQYAFGTGTIVKTDRFDLRITPEMQREIVAGRAPGLEEALETFGGVPAVELDAEENWNLLQRRTTTQVFDLLTGKRWEWHGTRRVGVVNSYGNAWQVVDGEWYPAWGGYGCCY